MEKSPATRMTHTTLTIKGCAKMVEIIKAENLYVPDCGDLLYENSFLESLSDEHPVGQMMPLAVLDANPWHALKLLGINTTAIKKTYQCPYTGYAHYWIVPVALISDDLKNNYAHFEHWNKNYLFDHEWHEQMWSERRWELQKIQQLLLGSGYTVGTMSNDGFGEVRQTKVKLSNGDYLWVHFWVWYNK